MPAVANFAVVGADAGGGPHVKVLDANGQVLLSFMAYETTFTGGVRVAVGDIHGDGVPDIITAPGPGHSPEIKVFDGVTGALLQDFMAYIPSFTGGVYVAASDINGDGIADIITGAGRGGGPHVKVFSGKDDSLLNSFFAYDPSFTGGVRVAAGDVTGTGRVDIVTGAGAGGGPHVKVFNSKDNSVLRSFFAYDPSFTHGVYVACGDVLGDGKADIVTGTGEGSAPHVKVFGGADNSLLRSFFAYDPSFTGGVRVAVGNIHHHQTSDILTAAGPGGAPHVKSFDGTTLQPEDSLFAYALNVTGGVFVGCVKDVVKPAPTPTRVSGKVLTPDGKPLAGVPIDIGGLQGITAADGSFSIIIPPAGFTSPFNISVPSGDPQFDPLGTGTQVIPLNRDRFDPATGTSTSNPLQHPNVVTSFIDASMVYGSDPQRAAALRIFQGGRLKTSPGNLLPFDNATYFPNGPLNTDNNGISSPTTLFVAGDVRVNENIGLTLLHTVFLREHNHLADEIHQANPSLSDEDIYQQARRIIAAEIQHINYSEYLPLLLGPNALAPYTGYNPNVDPTPGALFTTAAFRFAHSETPQTITPVDANGKPLSGEILSLLDGSFDSRPLLKDGVDPILRGLVAQAIPAIAPFEVDGARNMLFGPPGSGGLDLVSVDIQRGRDLGLPSYNQARKDFGLAPVTSFAQITSNTAVQAELQQAYGSVDKIDVLVGMVSEDHVPGAMVGPLLDKVITDQFQRLRDGDRYWYQNGQFTPTELVQIDHTTLSDIIERNTGLTNLPTNAFTNKTAPLGPAPAGTPALALQTSYRSFDGTGNNLPNPKLGSTGTDIRVDSTIRYGDGISTPTGADQPSPRVISNTIFSHVNPVPDPSGANLLHFFWGQFITHDMDLTPSGLPDTIRAHGEALPGPVTYHLVSKSLSALIGHAVQPGVNNVISQPIILAPG